MTLVEDDFWREVLGGTAEGPGISADRQHFCKPEVAYLTNTRTQTYGMRARRAHTAPQLDAHDAMLRSL